jgi:hypothetical protein
MHERLRLIDGELHAGPVGDRAQAIRYAHEHQLT